MFERNSICHALLWIALALSVPPEAAAAVGRTSGTFAVSSAGAATYTIPIWTSPGPRGVKPQLALTYNSNSGVGYVGVGWSLFGLSAITRCNKTYAQDGSPGAVTLTSNDAFCLNGCKPACNSDQANGVTGVQN